MRVPITIFACCALQVSAAAQTEHRDIHVTEEDGRLVTGAVQFDEPGQPVTDGVRIFVRDMGELGVAQYTDDPGFNAFSATLTQDMDVFFDVIDALRLWDPVAEDFETISPVQLEISRFSYVGLTPTTAGGFLDGPRIADTGASGGFHQHFDFFLDTPAPSGIYVMTILLHTDNPAVGPSESVFVLFRYQDPSDPDPPISYDGPVAYLESQLAPPPACPGDIDGDNATNLADFSVLASNFGAFGLPHGNGESRNLGDLTDDGEVNLADFSVLAADFGCTP
jgi:hypothetical protein